MSLDEFVDEMIRRARPLGYTPITFMRMRDDHGTAQAIRRLVETSEPQSGFRRLRDIGMKDWTLEAAVLRYPETAEFTQHTAEYAKARLDGILDT
jgi:hypothetical protein